MASNVEWKAKARDLDRQRVLAAELTDGPPEVLLEVAAVFNGS
jgi:hypothetical protein